MFLFLMHIKINKIFAMETPKIIDHAVDGLFACEVVLASEEGRRDLV